jgi:uncharacterized protein YukE
VSGEVVVEMPPGDPAALESLAGQLATCADAMTSLVHETGKVTTAAAERADWTGSAADGYRQFCSEMVTSAAGIPAALREICSAVRGYADTLAAAQQRVRSAVQDANSASPTARPAAVDAAQRVSASACGQARDGARTAAARVDAAKSGLAGVWESTEPGRKLIELVLAPFDTVAADHWIDLLKEMAGQPRDWLKDLDSEISEVEALQKSGKSVADELMELGGSADRTVSKLDAWDAFAPGWLRASAKSISEIRGLSDVLAGLGLVADVSGLISPQNSGVMGTVDRLAAGSNAAAIILQQGLARGVIKFKPATADDATADGAAEAAPEEAAADGGTAVTEEAATEAVTEGGEVATEAAVDTGLITLNASLDWIPVAGEVVMIGTGIYLAGTFLYQHWTPFRDAAKAVGHATVRVVDDIGHGVEHGVDSVVNDLTDWGPF